MATRKGLVKPRCLPPCVQVYQDRADRWRWRLWSRNRKIIADSAGGKGYTRRRDAVRAGVRTVIICRGKLAFDRGTEHTAWFDSTHGTPAKGPHR